MRISSALLISLSASMVGFDDEEDDSVGAADVIVDSPEGRIVGVTS